MTQVLEASSPLGGTGWGKGMQDTAHIASLQEACCQLAEWLPQPEVGETGFDSGGSTKAGKALTHSH